jgi:Flp pilus assembly protein TadG
MRGAAALLVTALAGTVMTGAVGAVDAAAAVAGQGRAENAADAAAHAAAALLASDAGRDKLSIAVQAGAPCDSTTSSPTDVGPTCGRATTAAGDVARRNNAVLLRLTVGPDLRDVREGRGVGRLVVLALVAVPRGLPVLPAHCPPSPGSGPDLCWAEAWSAAQEAG